MATDDTPGKQQRHVYGPRPIGALLPSVTRSAFRTRSPASAQLMADWIEIIGPALGAVTQPRRLSSGVLTLSCSGPIALELQHLSGPLMQRINAHFGRTLVEAIRFVQDSAPGATRPPRSGHRAQPTPVDVPGVPPGPLRDALAALGGALVAEQKRDPA